MKAEAHTQGLSISTKDAIEISKYLQGKSTQRAKAILENTITQKEAIPYTRFTNGVGHRKGEMASGRYPKLAAQAFLSLVKTAEANAHVKGLGTDLIITSLIANKGSRSYHYGRKRGVKTKSTHLTLIIEEGTVEKEGSKPEPKKEAKPAEIKAVPKEKPAEKKTEEKPEAKKETKPVQKEPEKKPEEKKKEEPTVKKEEQKPEKEDKK
tara:strand:+ start:44 stop:670 length:627 start_codon:yes stop_codon:yes gene_type:complete